MSPSVTHASAQELTGQLLSFRVVSDDFWGFGSLRSPQLGEVSITGKLLGAGVGDTLLLKGVWHEHPRHGRQFKVRQCEVQAPRDNEGMEKWITSRLPGIGPKRARALVDKHGLELWDVIEKEPDRLCEIDGLTPKARDAIVAAYRGFRGERDRMVRFRGWGLTDAQAAKIIEVWKDKAESELRKNPYAVIEHVHGFGFKRADELARKMGLPFEAPARIRAGVAHVLKEAAGLGHCYLSGRALAQGSAKVLQLDPTQGPQLVAAELLRVLEEGRLVKREHKYYLPALDSAEQRVARRVDQLCAVEPRDDATGWNESRDEPLGWDEPKEAPLW
jgi:ATP-dependent exoDNAse (exonuclease V) alpha subunit